jgi:hypothetical protein
MSNPPEAMVRVWRGFSVTEPPLVRFNELMDPEARSVVPAERRALLPAERNDTVSDPAKGLRIAPAVVVEVAARLSIVANEVPTPVAVVSMMAYDKIPFVAVPVAPAVPPTNATAAVLANVAVPAPATVPRLVPLNNRVAPAGTVPTLAMVRFACWPAPAVRAITELPAKGVRDPSVSKERAFADPIKLRFPPKVSARLVPPSRLFRLFAALSRVRVAPCGMATAPVPPKPPTPLKVVDPALRVMVPVNPVLAD